MTLQFYVKNQTLSLNPAQKEVKIASDSKNYLKARFIFQTSEWTRGVLRYALFTHNGQTYKKILGIELGCKSNECFVAPEVIQEGNFTVSVFCDDLITSTTEVIPVVASGYTENVVNQENTPTVLEQMNQLMYQYANLCNDILKECQQVEERVKEENG
jgi:hypothetical protein